MECDCGDHYWKHVGLGLVAFVSPIDGGILQSNSWRAKRNGLRFYVERKSPRSAGKQKTIALHRQLAGFPSGSLVDHRNGNGLDNRRGNIRKCSSYENSLNRRMRPGKAVPYKGVRKSGSRFSALITVHKIQHYLGTFATAEEAHSAYVAASLEFHGEFSRTA